ncbi:MAG: hypothetical protein K2Y37_09740 [Pirellulales bacterium]|nr:hypothetical protein [Pirellulales bacterium]
MLAATNGYARSTSLPARACAALVGAALLTGAATSSAIELREAVVAVPKQQSPQATKAVAMLVDEVHKRTGIRWQVSELGHDALSTAIVIMRADGRSVASGGPESFQIKVAQKNQATRVEIIGRDDRGILFGIGQLLRAMRLSAGSITIDDDYAVATSPKYPLRGHQLGYRPKTNSYDAWDLPQWEQYYRDLAVFGCNAVELVPPRTDDAATSPHFPRPQLEMMTGMSKLADDYGLDVWIWYPALDKDYGDPATIEFALEEWGCVFDALPRIDAVLVPGGDPGHTPPKLLMPLLEKQTARLRQKHPRAQMWVSPQGFTQAWLDDFLAILRDDNTAWLTGVVFAPQVRIPLPELRKLVPERYPIRHYPDITHTRQCQYPVADWDVAFAITSARECICPRPVAMTQIFRLLQPQTIGFLTYSEGCNDDVNKFVWSGLGWNPDRDVLDILRDYSQYFIGPEFRDTFTQGLMALERNWQGPVLTNEGVDVTLEQFQDMERAASPHVLQNWRFQQALYRSYYDAYVRRRLIHETELEAQAMERLRAAPQVGATKAIDEAEAILARAEAERVAADWRDRVFALAEELWQSIKMQTSASRYQAIAVDRGATLDTIDYPLNNRRWLAARFKSLRKLSNDTERLAGLDEIVRWTDPGPGGFYDDLGNIARQPHLVRDGTFADDPGAYRRNKTGFEEGEDPDDRHLVGGPWRMSWIDLAEALWDQPLRLHYDGLDPAASYKLRVVYAGDGLSKKIRLVAGDNIEVHPLMAKPTPVRPVEFEIPREATRDGQLDLSWYREAGQGNNGRGAQVSEVWLMRK